MYVDVRESTFLLKQIYVRCRRRVRSIIFLVYRGENSGSKQLMCFI